MKGVGGREREEESVLFEELGEGQKNWSPGGEGGRENVQIRSPMPLRPWKVVEVF